jgi:hypothetical protein
MPSAVLTFPSPCEPDCRPRAREARVPGRLRELTAAWWRAWVRYAADPSAWSRR